MRSTQRWKATVASLVVALASSSARAAEITNIPEVGDHYSLVVFKKNENPQNILVVYTKLGRDCRFVSDPEHKPVFDFYWLMDGVTFKPVAALIKSGVRDRLQIDEASLAKASAPGRSSFDIALADLKEMSTDLEDPHLVVQSRRVGKRCAVDSLMRLGPSDHGATLRLSEIDTEAETTLLPPFRRPLSITLKGTNVKTAKPMSRTYLAR